MLIIASPLKADEKSQRRLLQKMENYLGFINSADFAAESGRPTAANTRIVVKLHPDSDSLISDLLGRCVAWVSENNATLVVEDL